MFVSVIVPAYNSETTIGDCLKSLENQDFPKNQYEIIVVDDGSTDNTEKIVLSFQKAKLLKQEHKGPAAARNLGLSRAKGDIVLFTDADCIPDKNWIKEMIACFSDPEVVGVAGTYKTLNKNKLIARYVGYEIELRHNRMKQFKNIDFVGTYSAAYRKSVLNVIGNFDTNFSEASGEDTDLSFRIAATKNKIIFCPTAFVWHRHPSSLLAYLKQKFNRAFWRVLLYKKHPSKIKGESYTPSTLIIQPLLAIVILSTFLFQKFSILLLALAFTFLLNVRYYYFMFTKEFKIGFVSIPLSLLRNIAYAFGTISGIIFLILKRKP